MLSVQKADEVVQVVGAGEDNGGRQAWLYSAPPAWPVMQAGGGLPRLQRWNVGQLSGAFRKVGHFQKVILAQELAFAKPGHAVLLQLQA